MHVGYKPGVGFWWAPTVVDEPAIKTLYVKHGESALHYMCLFSCEASLHSKITDLDERDKSVLDELRANKWGEQTGGGRMSYPIKLYTADGYDKAIEALLSLNFVPDISEMTYLRKEIAERQKELAGVGTSKDPKELSDKTKTRKDLQAYITTLHKSLREAEDEFSKRIEDSGIISLDVLYLPI